MTWIQVGRDGPPPPVFECRGGKIVPLPTYNDNERYLWTWPIPGSREHVWREYQVSPRAWQGMSLMKNLFETWVGSLERKYKEEK